MNRALVSALAIASLALAAACGGSGGGGHATPAAPASPVSGALASGKVVLAIPNAASMSASRRAQFVSAGANSATIALNGGAATLYDVSPGSTNCVTNVGVRTCSLPITSGSGTLAVTVTLYASTNGTGPPLGSASGSTPVTAPTPFSVSIDINPAVATAITPAATFANGLPSIAYQTSETGSFGLTFEDASNTVIPSTNSSTFLTPVTLTASDPHVTFGSTINNASQTAQIIYDGSAAVGATFVVTAKAGTTTIGTFTMKTGGYFCEFMPPAGAASQPSGIAAGPDGNIWFTEEVANNVARATLPASCTAPPAITEYPMPTSSAQPFAITAGPAGDTRMWFAEDNASNIGTIDTTAPVPLESPASADIGVTAFANHIWFMNDGANTVDEYNLSPVFIASATFAGGCIPGVAAGGPDGMLWVTCSAIHHAVYRIDPANVTGPPTLFTTNAGTGGIAAGPDSAMWFCEAGSKIGRISIPGGAYTEYAVPSGNPLDNIALGPDGAMWFTDGVNKIGRIDVGTKQIVEFQIAANSDPVGITAGPDGWLWFTEQNTGNIGRIQPPI